MPIILRVQGGFCNRLRAIVCGCLWAEDLNTKLVIYWPEETGHMPCSIQEILDITTIPYLVGYQNGYIRNARQVLSHADMESVLSVQPMLKSDEIRIESYSIFHEDLLHKTERALGILRQIQVAQSIQNIAKYEPGVKECVGMHIRRTDHVKCIIATPLEKFGWYVENSPGQKFFLATDDAEVKKMFVEKYKMLSPVHTLGRHTKEQQYNGIIDWMLLQRCTRIVASSGSSFSELAAWRAGIPLEVHFGF